MFRDHSFARIGNNTAIDFLFLFTFFFALTFVFALVCWCCWCLVYVCDCFRIIYSRFRLKPINEFLWLNQCYMLGRKWVKSKSLFVQWKSVRGWITSKKYIIVILGCFIIKHKTVKTELQGIDMHLNEFRKGLYGSSV